MKSSYFIKDLSKSIKPLVISGCLANGLGTLVVLEKKELKVLLFNPIKSEL